MIKLSKVLLAAALTFSLFMIYGSVYANQSVPCDSDNCRISVRLLNDGEEVLVDPEFLTLDGSEILYAVSISSDHSFIWDGTATMRFGARDVSGLLNYVPLGYVGEIGSNKKDGYFYVGTAQEKMDIDSSEKVVGYLIADRYSAEDVTVEFVSGQNYSDFFYSNLTVDGIKYVTNEEYIETNLFFGDFKYNYIVEKGDMSNSYWQPVTNNSNKITIDNTKSFVNLNYTLEWTSNDVTDIGLTVHSSFMSDYVIGDGFVVLDKGKTSENFRIPLGSKEILSLEPNGGNITSVKEIQKQGGNIGYISLYIYATE